jgi:hypothetical protein
MLIVVPGVFVAVRYAFFGQILASKPISPLTALREAASLAENRWRALFCLLLISAAQCRSRLPIKDWPHGFLSGHAAGDHTPLL